MSKEYPVEIYPKPNERIKDSAERIYDLGFRDGRFKERLEASNPLAGWSNLTEAIQTGERIDWERLDGKKICFKHIDGSVVKDILIRDHSWDASDAAAWVLKHHQLALGALFRSCFDDGRDGWSLWIKGDVPLRKRTADHLEPGTGFCGAHPEVCEGEAVLCVVIEAGDLPKRVLYPGPTISRLASEVEVIDIYGEGTFEKPEGDA